MSKVLPIPFNTEMIRELRRLEDKHKNDFIGTCENNWSAMCHDVADRLEEQEREIAELNYTIEALKIGGVSVKLTT